MGSEERLLNRIVVNPKVMAGKPVIKGTRIPVEQVLRLLAQGLSFDEILKDYPHLKKMTLWQLYFTRLKSWVNFMINFMKEL